MSFTTITRITSFGPGHGIQGWLQGQLFEWRCRLCDNGRLMVPETPSKTDGEGHGDHESHKDAHGLSLFCLSHQTRSDWASCIERQTNRRCGHATTALLGSLSYDAFSVGLASKKSPVGPIKSLEVLVEEHGTVLAFLVPCLALLASFFLVALCG
jgi:hypothetical protein